MGNNEIEWDGFIGIFDDFIPIEEQENLMEVMIHSRQFPWYFSPASSFDPLVSLNEKKYSFPTNFHIFTNNGGVNSPYADYVLGIGDRAVKAAGFEVDSVIQTRSYLQFPLSEIYRSEGLVDSLHCDWDGEHLVVIYYLNDTDGDTIVTDRKWLDEEGVRKDLKLEEERIIGRVTPKKGRALVFDGKYYHTAIPPTTDIRCIINYNFVKNER